MKPSSIAAILCLSSVPVLGADSPPSPPMITFSLEEAIAIQQRLEQLNEVIREQQRQIEKLRARYVCS